MNTPLNWADMLAAIPAQPEPPILDETKTDADLPLAGQVLQTVTNLDTYDAASDRFSTSDVRRAQVTTSMVDTDALYEPRGTPERWERHKVVLDIDVPAKLVPSSTPGHSHLYIDAEMSWEHYSAILIALGAAGVLEEGYVKASLSRKHTAVRLPWVKKPDPNGPLPVPPPFD